MHVVLARMLSVADYGLFALGLTLATLVSVLASLGMPFCAVRFLPSFIAQGDNAAAHRFERTSLGLTALGLVLFTVVGGGILLGGRTLLPETLLTGVLIALPLLIVLGLSQTLHSLLIARGRIIFADALQNVVRPGLVIVALLALAYLTVPPTLLQATVIWTAVGLLVAGGLIAGYPFMKKATAGADAPPGERHIWIRAGLAIMLIATGTAMMERIDVLIIGTFLSAEDVAVYSVASRIALIGAMAINAINAAFGPPLSVAISARDGTTAGPLARRAAVMASVFLSIFWAILLVFGGTILLLFGESYTSGWTVLIILGLAQLLVATFGATGGIVVFAGAEKTVVKASLLALLLNLCLNLVLVPAIGAVGAAIGSLAALFVLQAQLALWCRRTLDHPTDLWSWPVRAAKNTST